MALNVGQYNKFQSGCMTLHLGDFEYFWVFLIKTPSQTHNVSDRNKHKAIKEIVDLEFH